MSWPTGVNALQLALADMISPRIDGVPQSILLLRIGADIRHIISHSLKLIIILTYHVKYTQSYFYLSNLLMWFYHN